VRLTPTSIDVLAKAFPPGPADRGVDRWSGSPRQPRKCRVNPLSFRRIAPVRDAVRAASLVPSANWTGRVSRIAIGETVSANCERASVPALVWAAIPASLSLIRLQDPGAC
jgi:hypothetical protein